MTWGNVTAGDDTLAQNEGLPMKPNQSPHERTLMSTIPIQDFGAAQWAAKRTMRTLPTGKLACVPLGEFFHTAVRDKIRSVVLNEIERGKPIPPDIAATLDRWRRL